MIRLVDNKNITDPRINLALEEYCLRNLDLENNYVLLYVNKPSVIIGRHQNVFEETNPSFVNQKQIPVVRRISGGGAVYHDAGNLNYSFIRKYENNTLMNIKKIIGPIVAALNRLGVPALVNGKNDITAKGKKISGNAQFSDTKGIIIHGTLLFDSELDTAEQALSVKKNNIDSKALKSIRSSVANISDYLKNTFGMDGFRHHLLSTLDEILGGLEDFRLDGKDWEKILELAEIKYNSWDWNFGKSPDFTVWKSNQFKIGKLDTRIDVKKGYINEIKFTGNHGILMKSDELIQRLRGQRYDGDSIKSALAGFDLDHHLGEVKLENFIEYIH